MTIQLRHIKNRSCQFFNHNFVHKIEILKNDVNWIFLGIYKVVEWFLAEETKKKLCFLKVGDEDKILMYIAKEDLLKELGGDVSINTPENRNDVVTLSEDKVVEAKRKKKEFLEASTEKMGNDWAGCTELFLEWTKQP